MWDRKNKRRSRGQKRWVSRVLNPTSRGRSKSRPRRSKRKSFLQEAFAIAFVAWLAFQAVFSQIQPLVVSENSAPTEAAAFGVLLNSGVTPHASSGLSEGGFLGQTRGYAPNPYAPNSHVPNQVHSSAYSNPQPITIPASSGYQVSNQLPNYSAVPASCWSYSESP